MKHIHEKGGIRGIVTVRSHPAGTIDRYHALVREGKLAEAKTLLKKGKIETRQRNLVVWSLNYGYDILIQFLLSAYTGSFAFANTLGIAWGEIGTNLAPGAAPTVATGSSGVLTGAYQYLVTFVTALGETTAGPASATVNPSSQQVALSTIPTGVSGTVTGRNIYRTLAGGSTFYLLAALPDNTTTTYTDNTADTSLPTTQPPGVSTAGSINPMNTDTALTNPTNRTTVSYAADNGFNTAEFQFFFPDASLANQTYYEFGTFIGGNASIGTGNMFNHALFTNPYSKSAGTDTTVECDFDFESSASGEFDESQFG